MRVLTVCLGNICRSPAAEAALRALAPPGVTVDSAGTAGWHRGDPPYPPMVAAGTRRGLDLTALRARQFETRDFGRFDLILAMDRDNLATIEALRPAGNAVPVRLFLSALPEAGQDVPDPYYTRDFDGCLDLICTASRAWLPYLQHGLQQGR
ncbi:low molecular weight protein-tyrosine-phosphatase [Szabonella alba]|uniref:protein-tyrosine-phosphatase n=1 Tax=Szabonella alba TaxID=2804194 RepID=A0A8K0VEI2_9RHOB|nr:low molecular weight protein-tyrosine-phosphatase [Szabonella alba]MBL4918209.1 low molecular weight phosphotyrosine protein phosphatase [Szabonella alba]